MEKIIKLIGLNPWGMKSNKKIKSVYLSNRCLQITPKYLQQTGLK